MAMSTGRVVALIQAMGGGADPAVIESAVQDWLDAHPEATTTVQDGSITEQKLATSIAQKLGLISSLSDEIDSVEESMYKDWNAVTIQKNTDSPLVLDSPSGYIHVKATEEKIYTGTRNFIDLFHLKQGIFVDSHSGVTIEIDGNEIYIHGTTTAGFRFNPQTGEFYTDSFANHPADFSDFPDDSCVYKFCWFESDNNALPSDIYFAVLGSNGSISPTALSGKSKEFYSNVQNQYVAIYSNSGISNISARFTIGLKINALGGTAGGIETIAKLPYNTTIISNPGFYQCGEFTWTGADNVYTAVSTIPLVRENPLTKGHVYAWFGDSLSQLRDLPNRVAELLNVTVHDCTFAGAPLTFGNPTMYQPTGFMSLCNQIASGDFTPLSDALTAQEQSGINVTEKRQHLATLENLDFNAVTDIVVLAGTNDFDNDYVNATNFVSGFSGAIETLLTAYPHLIIYVLSPLWRGDKTQGKETLPTMPDIVQKEKEVAENYCLPFADLYHTSGINAFTKSVYLDSDMLHPSTAGDILLSIKCAKFLQSN